MTRGFWKDPERYEETYWSRFPDVWLHGDWAEIDEDGQWYILGRSDDTIKIAGKRLGPAEVESVLVEDPDAETARTARNAFGAQLRTDEWEAIAERLTRARDAELTVRARAWLAGEP